MLAIGRQDGMADFERHLQQPDIGGRALALPINIRGGGSLGRSVGLAQLVVTWAQRSDSPEVKMYAKAGGRYPKFIEQLYGFAATYFADSVTTRGDDANIRTDLMLKCRPRIKAMHDGVLKKTAEGRKVEFILAHGARNQFHPALYKRTPTRTDLLDRQRHGELVNDPLKMADLLRRCVDQYRISPSRERARLRHLLDLDDLLGPDDLFGRDDNALGHLLYESFRNTAEHAYLDVDGQIPSRGMRSVTISVQQVDRHDFVPSTVLGSEHPSAAAYFAGLRDLHQPDDSEYRDREHIDILEISVLDSGPGFSQMISKRCNGDDSSTQDTQLVAQCFRKHESAKSGPASGMGLSRILECIHVLKGFMRVRTASTESFFAAAPDYSPTMDPEGFVCGGLAPIRGTSITFGVPLVY